MGNQLTGIAPSQILPVEHYLTEFSHSYHFESNLGSTRFFKVAKAKSKEGPIVVKVFVIHDPSLPLRAYKEQLELIQSQLQDCVHCLPFHRAVQTDRAALLSRQYVKDSLYDRISTRPFLNTIEKKWLAFQLLYSVNRCHRLSVCHGDIKSENVMVTSWNWLLLTDFASFKPTYLPVDNPADFSYFFDTSRRRTCYIAPERFVESSWKKSGEMTKDSSSIDLTAEDVKTGDLTPAMDIFSVGCVLAELFNEGTPLFDLSELLSYRSAEYYPTQLLARIEDPDIKSLIESMIQRDAGSRLTAEDYLMQQRGKAFPEYFYTVLIMYCQRFAAAPTLTPDERVVRLNRDLDRILALLKCTDEEGNHAIKDDHSHALVVIVSLLTSSIRGLQHCSSKLLALEISRRLSQHLASDIILDRLMPYILHLAAPTEPFPAVRAAALRVLIACLALVRSLPPGNSDVFPEYILPAVGHLVSDPATCVRVAYAEVISELADTAVRFLEMSQLNICQGQQLNIGQGQNVPAGSSVIGGTNVQQKLASSYDSELQTLREMIQIKVATLLSDPDNVVKQTLLLNGITNLCLFFGRQKANDVLLSHMITFLNDKADWRLRAAFYDTIVGVAAYIGWQSSAILVPLLEQGLTDPQEFVIMRSLTTIGSISELGLLRKASVREILRSAVHFLIHPNVWIRHAVVGLISSVASHLNPADLHCYLLPLVEPFLRQPMVRVDDVIVLLGGSKAHVSRALYDQVLKTPSLEALMDCLTNRRLVRSISRHGHEPQYPTLDDSLTASLRKLSSQGLSSTEEEDKLVSMSEFLVKLGQIRAGLVESGKRAAAAALQPGGSEVGGQQQQQKPGEVNLSHCGNIIRQIDLQAQDSSIQNGASLLSSTDGSVTNLSRRARRIAADSPVSLVSEDWKQMFGAASSLMPLAVHSPSSTTLEKSSLTSSLSGPSLSSYEKSSFNSSVTTLLDPSMARRAGDSNQLSISQSSTGSAVILTNSTLSLGPGAGSNSGEAIKTSVAQCKINLGALIRHKVLQYRQDCLMRDLMDGEGWEPMGKPPGMGWKPQGRLVAHLHEHRGAVNRVCVSEGQERFASCSNDGTVKLWDCARLEGKSITNRSSHTYNKQSGQIKTVCFCEGSQSIASASDSGAIHVFRPDGASSARVIHTKNLDINSEGLVVDMKHFDTGSENIIAYATVHGLIVGWDLRSPSLAWRLENDPRLGLITSFDIERRLCWLALGTSSGAHVCWDMRFHLPINTVEHPTRMRVRRLLVNNRTQSSIFSAVQGNNEVSVWDVETGARQQTLWASSTTPLSHTQASPHCVNGLCLVHTAGATSSVPDRGSYLLTAGSDMRVRYWDLAYPANSQIIIPAATDTPSKLSTVSYHSRILEGSAFVQEVYGKPRGASSGGVRPSSAGQEESSTPERPSPGHHDVITDVTVCHLSQCFVITSSRDGMIKVWK